MALLVTLLASAMTLLASPDDTPKIFDMSDLEWIKGCWEGEGFGGVVESCSMSAPDGRYTGTFQLIQNGSQVLSQIYILDNFDAGAAMRVKHFNADFTGWEDKTGYVEFKILEIRPGYIAFEGLTYRLNESGERVVEIQSRTPEGEVVPQTLIYRRVQ